VTNNNNDPSISLLLFWQNKGFFCSFFFFFLKEGEWSPPRVYGIYPLGVGVGLNAVDVLSLPRSLFHCVLRKNLVLLVALVELVVVVVVVNFGV
jgi:hypothetical protein